MVDEKKPPKPPRKNGRFVAGFSGNPGGRPARLKEVRELGAAMTTAIMQSLFEINQDPTEHGVARVAAGREIMDRTWGKSPITQLNIEASGDVSGQPDIQGMQGLTALLQSAQLHRKRKSSAPQDATDADEPDEAAPPDGAPRGAGPDEIPITLLSTPGPVRPESPNSPRPHSPYERIGTTNKVRRRRAP